MELFAQKVKSARAELGISQTELAEKTGVSLRSILAYEKNEKKPRQSTMIRLAKALEVSVKFLTDDACNNPLEDIEKDGFIKEAYQRYGAAGARDVNALLEENKALFAGGELSESEKDEYFTALMKAYIACKEEAKLKFGKNHKNI